MKVRKRETFEAEQWFPGKIVEGVMGDDPHKWCGCVIAGGPAHAPHIHPSISECWLVKPSDWVVKDNKGNRCLVKADVFDDIYEKI